MKRRDGSVKPLSPSRWGLTRLYSGYYFQHGDFFP